MSLMNISPFIISILFSVFLKSTFLLIIATLLHISLKKLSSNFKHTVWLAILFIVVLIPVRFFIVSPDFFNLEVQTKSSSEAVRILDAVTPIYNELGARTQSASGIGTITDTVQSTGLIFPWAVFFVVLWIAGIMFSITRVILGKIGIIKICADCRSIESRHIVKTVAFLSKNLGIRRNIQVLTSSACRVPFTYKTLKPIILLPPGATGWPSERLRSVLIHEMAHVKRFDSFTLLFARVVCSIFWFIPTVWIAYRNLHMEQEKSCDEYAVGEGIEADRYARHLLNVVRVVRGRVLLTGIFISRGRKKMLEKRILHLLRPGALKFLSKKKVFIAIALVGFLLLLPILVFNPMFAYDVKKDVVKKISEKDLWETVSGTWVNTEYTGIQRFEQKVIIRPDGKWECYQLIKDTNPSRNGYYHTFTEAWIDSEGVIWYNFIDKIEVAGDRELIEVYGLGKISEYGNRWEYIMDAPSYPTEWDTSCRGYKSYNQYTRQKN
jgi:beta-lactamase regulating signal transducer with metallopeptidase domain